MILLKDIYYKYPQSDFAIGIDELRFEPGKKYALIGPSGFGKTTLLNLIAGILIPEKGHIEHGKNQINRMSEQERRAYRITNIGFVFQDFKLVDYLNVRDNILLPYRLNQALADLDTGTFASEISKQLGIGDKLSRYPGKLSHGEKQRVAIARALITDPDLILADEPTGNLDPKNKQKIVTILFNYVDKTGKTLITVTHDTEIMDGFDRVIDLRDWRGES